MIRLLTIILILSASAFAQKVLHVSTIPTHADIYVQSIRPDHTKQPDYTSPAFIVLTEDQTLYNEITISLFNPSFADTTIRVKLSDKDTSYLVVSQQPLLEEDLLKKQQSEISKRGRKEFGKTMMLSSLFPLAVGAIAGAFTYYEINQANDCKKVVENSAITDSKKYRNNLSDFKDHRRNAKIAKRTTYAGLAVGATLLSVGFILSF